MARWAPRGFFPEPSNQLFEIDPTLSIVFRGRRQRRCWGSIPVRRVGDMPCGVGKFCFRLVHGILLSA
jgi:hypothetical protein